MQDAGARRVSNAEGMRRMVRKHDCALPAQYTKHSNARGHSLELGLGLWPRNPAPYPRFRVSLPSGPVADGTEKASFDLDVICSGNIPQDLRVKVLDSNSMVFYDEPVNLQTGAAMVSPTLTASSFASAVSFCAHCNHYVP